MFYEAGRGAALCRASVYLYAFEDRMLHGTKTPRLDVSLQICCLGLLGAFQEWYVAKNLMGKYLSFENVHKNSITLFSSIGGSGDGGWEFRQPQAAQEQTSSLLAELCGFRRA